MQLNLAFIGFGTVGQGFCEILLEKEESLRQLGLEYKITAISDIAKGTIQNEQGLNLEAVLKTVKETGRIEETPGAKPGWNSLETITKSNSDIIVEVSYTDLKTAEPALSHFKVALENKKHLITTNKGPCALAFNELSALAKSQGVEFRYEGTVMSGTPIITLAQTSISYGNIKEIKGILNGTTNFILTEMEKGKSYQAALKQAQALGYAEAIPDADVLGWDTLAKIMILSNVLFKYPLKVSDIPRQGITDVSLEDIKKAREKGSKIKLIGRIKRERQKIQAEVLCERIPLTHPLASVEGALNAITFKTEYLGDVTIVGPGAGRKETGFALLSDLCQIYQRLSQGRKK
jgi:homoserine dehydrogenase